MVTLAPDPTLTISFPGHGGSATFWTLRQNLRLANTTEFVLMGFGSLSALRTFSSTRQIRVPTFLGHVFDESTESEAIFMEVVILFLIKSVGGSLIGHYLKKALERIDPHLETMITRGASPKEIKQYVVENNLNEEVEQLATNVVRDSLILPGASAETPTLETRSEFFARIIEAGFLLSSMWKADLLIKGTFFGPCGFMLFSSGSEKRPEVTRVGVSIKVGSGLGIGLKIAPFSDEQSTTELWTQFKQFLKRAKGDSNSYVTLRSLEEDLSPLTERCDVRELSATNITFYWAGLLAEREELAFSLNVKGKAAIGDWEKGMECFIQSVAELRELFVLPVTEREAIRSLSSRLLTLLDKNA